MTNMLRAYKLNTIHVKIPSDIMVSYVVQPAGKEKTFSRDAGDLIHLMHLEHDSKCVIVDISDELLKQNPVRGAVPTYRKRQLFVAAPTILHYFN